MTVDNIVSAAHLNAIEKLGTRMDSTFDAQTAMERGHLGGWNVRKQELITLGPGGELIIVTDKVALVRDSPTVEGAIDVLGTAGANYTPVQNEEHADLLNAIVDESGANFELAGSADGGRKIFISMKLPGHINVGGVDRVENSLVALNSHDGSMSFTLAVMPIRYACGNILNTPFGGVSNLLRVRHSTGVHKNLQRWARQALDLSFGYLDSFQAEAEQMIQTTMTQSKFEEIIHREFGAPEGAPLSTITKAQKKLDIMTELFAESSTQDGIRETVWAGFNALTEYEDHYSMTRGDAEVKRAEKAILNPFYKNRAMELMAS